MKNKLLTISQIKKALKDKEISVVDLVDYYLDRINKYNGKINAFLTIDEEGAYKKAKSIDKIISLIGNKAFDENPLLGSVVSHKDVFLTKGLRTTAGSKVLENHIPQYSSTAVKRINLAGAITLGKLNCDAWAHGSSGENSDFGLTRNPWDTGYTPGGSSSGSGACLSADMSTFTTGTDTCGSIRLPANYNYVYALKPTYGVIPRFGVIAMASSLDTVGIMGRTVDDVEEVFNVVKGKDMRDATVMVKDKPIKSKYIIGVPKEFFENGIDNEVKKNIDKALDILKTNGFEVLPISLPHTKYGISVYYIIQPAEVSSNLSRYDGIRYGRGRDAFGAEAKRRIMLGTYVLSAGYRDEYYIKAMKVRNVISMEVDEAFKKVDAIIAPVTPTPPFKIGERTDDPLKMYLTDILAATANLSGIPSLAIPFGKTNKGLPLGFQLMGDRFSEKILFDISRKFETLASYKPEIASL